jgi:hypothetical protein
MGARIKHHSGSVHTFLELFRDKESMSSEEESLPTEIMHSKKIYIF